MTQAPRSALLLGYAGLLPPFALLAVAILDLPRQGFGFAVPALTLGFLYAAIILSFLGGLWWGGVAAARGDGVRHGPVLGLSVLPSLAAILLLGTIQASPLWGALAMAAAILATLLVDRTLVRAGVFPGWWMRLRAPLSIGLALAVAGLGLVAATGLRPPA